MASASTPSYGSPKAKLRNFLRTIESHVQGTVVAGLIELVPLIVTVIVLTYLINATDEFVRSWAFIKERPWDFPGIGLIVMAAVFYAVGALAVTRPGRLVLDWKSVVMNHIPVVKTVFGVTQQATASMGSEYSFSRVVFIEWPRDGMMAMGFVTGRVQAPGMHEGMVSVYIPTVPNPTSGNMAFVLEDDIVETNITVEEAMKLIFSGGIVLPDTISMARMPREVRREDSFIGKYVRED